MSTQPLAPKLRPPLDPIKIEANFTDVDNLEHAHHELDRARLMLTLAMECSDTREAEHRAMLLDAALSALAPAIVEFGRTLRLLHIRVRVERETRARRLAGRAAAIPERTRYQTKKFRTQAHRKEPRRETAMARPSKNVVKTTPGGVPLGYRKPILIELYVEIHFDAANLSPSKIFDIVPPLRAASFDQLEIVKTNLIGLLLSPQIIQQQPQQTTPINVEPTGTRVRCWSADRKRLVQLDTGLVVVNQVNEYPGWDAFKQTFNTVMGILTKTMPGVAPQSIALHTTDQIVAAGNDFVVGRYFNCDGIVIPKWFSEATAPADILLGKGTLAETGSNRQIQIVCSRVNETVVAKIDSVFHDLLGNSSVEAKLETLHVDSTKTFESWITDHVRGMMGGRP